MTVSVNAMLPRWISSNVIRAAPRGYNPGRRRPEQRSTGILRVGAQLITRVAVPMIRIMKVLLLYLAGALQRPIVGWS